MSVNRTTPVEVGDQAMQIYAMRESKDNLSRTL